MQKITLRALRANYSLSAKEVAKELGIHHQTLLKYENDSTDIPISLLETLANFYKVDKNTIFLGEKFVLKQTFKKMLAV
ncbi:helix-turn-helix transcriptional regulator [Carnobacteriaceae bacterium zg-ZUI78]|nr:helix-turn-helix transcriptional regulator [Carnobacteriaceae bacterium zg-ZUI78]